MHCTYPGDSEDMAQTREMFFTELSKYAVVMCHWKNGGDGGVLLEDACLTTQTNTSSNGGCIYMYMYICLKQMGEMKSL